MESSNKFGQYLKTLRTSKGYSQRKLSMLTGISNSTISRLESGQNDPDIETLKKLASPLGVSHHDLMKAAGYIKSTEHDSSNAQSNKTSKLTRRDEREIEKILEETRKKLENAEGLMFFGEPASPEAIQSILDSMRIGMEIAKQRNKEKYTPKKYKKNKDKDHT